MSVARRAARVLLAGTAVLGTLALLAVATMAGLGLTPVVVQSGSMSPTFDAGTVLVTRDVPASQVDAGQVVTVLRADGSRVSHRVVSTTPGDRGSATMRLRGDANTAPDADPVTVRSAGVTVVSIPHLGSVIAWSSRAPGSLLVLGGSALLLAVVIRPRSGAETPSDKERARAPRPQATPAHRRGRVRRALATPGASLVLLALVCCLVRASPATAAAWSDRATASGTVIRAASIRPLAAPRSCVADQSAQRVRVTWRRATVDAVSYTVLYGPPSGGQVPLSIDEDPSAGTYSVDVPYALLVGTQSTNYASVEIRSRRETWTARSATLIRFDPARTKVACDPLG